MKIKSIGLLLTEYCTAECDCCYLSCTSRKTSVMQLDNALDYIQQASKISNISSISITGGEPFAHYDLLLEIIKFSKEMNFDIICGSNGFWANSRNVTFKILNQLKNAGLKSLNLSTDEFHLPYVSISNIRNIIDVANEIKFNINISFVVTKESLQVNDILTKIGINYQHITSVPCLPIGRALKKIKKESIIYEENIPTGKCFIDNTLYIDTKGNVYPCMLTPALLLGSLNEQNLRNIIQKYINNKFCNIFKEFGAEWFIENIKRHNAPIPIRSRYVCLCDVCHSIFKNKVYLDYYKQWL